MALLYLHPVSPCSLWKATKGPVSQLSNPFFLTQTSPLHHKSVSSISSSPPGTLGARNIRASISTRFIEDEEAVPAYKTPPPEPELVDTPTVVEISIPPESLVGFEADYERVSAAWPEDLATTTDDAKIEQFVTYAHALVRRWLPEKLVSRLEHYMYDPKEAAALVIRGLPIDKDLPPTEPNAHLKKLGKCVSETWLVGIGRIVGQVFIYGHMRGSRPGMGLLVREIYTTADKVNFVGAEGSRELLDFHVDFFRVRPQQFPNVIAFIGVRGSRNKEGKPEGKTLLCDNRRLYRTLDPADIQVLRTEKITWNASTGRFSRHVIEGSESNPQINLFPENLYNMGGFERVVEGSPEAVAAYKRVKKIAAAKQEGVWLDGGDVLLLNQRKAAHGRSPYVAKYDGKDRWLQRTYINSGGFWDAGLTQWPCRTVSLEDWATLVE